MGLLIGFNFLFYDEKILNVIFIFGVHYLIQYLETLILEEFNPVHIVVRNDRMDTISLSRDDNYHYLKYLTIILQSDVVMISSPNPKVWFLLCISLLTLNNFYFLPNHRKTTSMNKIIYLACKNKSHNYFNQTCIF